MTRRPHIATMLKPAAGDGLLLAAGTFALQWFDHRLPPRDHIGEFYIALIAGGFLVLGIVIGIRTFAPRAPGPFDGNPQAVAALGISARELMVLQHVAAGRSNKEIARILNISPNTVKTHIARLYEKLGASRRTEAVGRARDLGIIG